MKVLGPIVAAFLMFPLTGIGSAMAQGAPWPDPREDLTNYREIWRQTAVTLSGYAKKRDPKFIVLAKGAPDLLTRNLWEEQRDNMADPVGKQAHLREPVGAPSRDYLQAIDGVILENLHCGDYALKSSLKEATEARLAKDRQDAEDKRLGIVREPDNTQYGPFSINPEEELKKAKLIADDLHRADLQRWNLYASKTAADYGKKLFSLDHCAAGAGANAAQAARGNGFVPHIGSANLDTIPGNPGNASASGVTGIHGVKNWLPVLSGRKYPTKDDWIGALSKTNFDMIVVDVTHSANAPLTANDVKKLKSKALGARRLVLAVLPMGRAYDWRWYWKKGWVVGQPEFLMARDDRYIGAFTADMQNAEWKALLGKTIQGIVDLGFDGVMLDDMDSFAFFEAQSPVGK